jgi:hypothetical protein
MRLLFATACVISIATVSVSQTWTQLRSERAGKYKAKASFPKFRSTGPVARLANAEVETMARNFFAEFVANARQFDRDRIPTSAVLELDLTTTISIDSADLISGFVTVYDYSGGAHPNTRHWTFAFGRHQGRATRLNLLSVAQSSDSKTELVNKKLLPALNEAKKQRGGDPLEKTSGALSNQFVVTPAGLTWIFSNYDVGPYAEGSYQIKLGWKELAPYLNRRGPLAKWLVLYPTQTPTPGDGEMLQGFIALAGKVWYRERIAVPPDSMVVFRLMLGKEVLETRSVPYTVAAKRFEIRFSQAKVPATGVAQLYVELNTKERRWFYSEPIAVPRTGWESEREILLRRG